MNQTWLFGPVVLSLGVLAGIGYLMLARSASRAARRRSGSPLPGGREAAVEDWERKSQLAIEQLKELAAEQHHLPPEQYEAEKNRLMQEAAAALRAKDELLKQPETAAAADAASAKASPVSNGFFARHPELKGALWGGGVVGFFALVGVMLWQAQTPRADNQPMTGKAAMGGQGAPAQAGDAQAPDPELDAAVEKARANPSNVEFVAEVVHELLRRERFEDANALTEASIPFDPFHTETRVHRAMLQSIRGSPAEGAHELQRLADLYPDADEALLFVGSLYYQIGEREKALDAFERFAVEAPRENQPPQLSEGISMLRKELGIAAP